jgi:hypothetical protein
LREDKPHAALKHDRNMPYSRSAINHHKPYRGNSMINYVTVPRLLLLAVLSWVVCPNLLLAQNRTITRQYDPIIVSTGKLLPLANDSISVHTAYCYVNGEFKRSPFQIDELTAKGELETKDGIADDNDEAVFMPNGTGDRAPLDKWINGSANTRIELEVTDPLNNQKAWLYLSLRAQSSGSTFAFALCPRPRKRRRGYCVRHKLYRSA